MSQTKSYNTLALKGLDYNDDEFRTDMSSVGIDIPFDLLYKPEMNTYVINKMYEQNYSKFLNSTNPFTGEYYTDKEAKEEAGKLRQDALDNLDFIYSNTEK